MEIRLLTPSDAESYWKLRLEALKNHPEAFSSSYEEAMEKENPVEETAKRFTAAINHTFGAFADGELIGMVTLLQEKGAKIQHKAYIVAMYVTSGKQGTGIGKALLETAINKAKTIESIKKINLSVNASNEKAKSLYQKLGFQVFGHEKNALLIEGIYYDEEHMDLRL